MAISRKKLTDNEADNVAGGRWVTDWAQCTPEESAILESRKCPNCGWSLNTWYVAMYELNGECLNPECRGLYKQDGVWYKRSGSHEVSGC